MTVLSSLDAAGRRRLPATLPGYHAGRPPRDKGMRYSADPPTVEEIVAVMRHAAEDRHGYRLRGLLVVLWRAGLRVHEALALAEQDLDHRRGSLLVRSGKGGRRREVGMDEWGWEQLRPWLAARVELPVGPLFCVIDGAHPRSDLGGRGGAQRISPRRRPRWSQAPLRPAPAQARARTRTCPRGGAAQYHPAPARARESRHHIDLPAGHRPRGDHHRRAHSARADDVRQRRTQAVTGAPSARQRERHAALPLRPGEAAVPNASAETIGPRPERACAAYGRRRPHPWKGAASKVRARRVGHCSDSSLAGAPGA
jgi:hypothetical protein